MTLPRLYLALALLGAPACASAPPPPHDVRVVYVARHLWCGMPCDDLPSLGWSKVPKGGR